MYLIISNQIQISKIDLLTFVLSTSSRRSMACFLVKDSFCLNAAITPGSDFFRPFQQSTHFVSAVILGAVPGIADLVMLSD